MLPFETAAFTTTFLCCGFVCCRSLHRLCAHLSATLFEQGGLSDQHEGRPGRLVLVGASQDRGVSVWLYVAIVCRWARQRPSLVVDVVLTRLCSRSLSVVTKQSGEACHVAYAALVAAGLAGHSNCSLQLSGTAQLLGGKPSANSHSCQNPILGWCRLWGRCPLNPGELWGCRLFPVKP
jgi:hypothetical protein